MARMKASVAVGVARVEPPRIGRCAARRSITWPACASWLWGAGRGGSSVLPEPSPPMRQTSAHSSAVTGCTERRELMTSTILASFGLALAASSVTGFGTGATAFTSTHSHLPLSSLAIGMGERDHLQDADDLLALVRVIEEAQVAELHRPHVVARLVVAHAVPGLALGAARDEVVPREGIGLGFHQPIGHLSIPRAANIESYRIQSSALNGRRMSCAMASSTVARPSRMAFTASAIGISMPLAAARRTTAAAV